MGSELTEQSIINGLKTLKNFMVITQDVNLSHVGIYNIKILKTFSLRGAVPTPVPICMSSFPPNFIEAGATCRSRVAINPEI